MGRHDRERRKAPSLPRCSECGKAVSDCFACQPGGMHLRVDGRLQHVHARCLFRFNEYHAREGVALRQLRASRKQRAFDLGVQRALTASRLYHGGRP